MTRRNRSAYEVMAKRCDQCLYSDAKIIDDDAKRAVLNECVEQSHHFVCHKATLVGWDVACAGFHAEHPGISAASRLAATLGVVAFVTEAELIERSRRDK